MSSGEGANALTMTKEVTTRLLQLKTMLVRPYSGFFQQIQPHRLFTLMSPVKFFHLPAINIR